MPSGTVDAPISDGASSRTGGIGRMDERGTRCDRRHHRPARRHAHRPRGRPPAFERRRRRRDRSRGGGVTRPGHLERRFPASGASQSGTNETLRPQLRRETRPEESSSESTRTTPITWCSGVTGETGSPDGCSAASRRRSFAGLPSQSLPASDHTGRRRGGRRTNRPGIGGAYTNGAPIVTYRLDPVGPSVRLPVRSPDATATCPRLPFRIAHPVVRRWGSRRAPRFDSLPEVRSTRRATYSLRYRRWHGSVNVPAAPRRQS
jgi:hypothetical protein